ncbi:hypothetical protein B484DRAFT_469286 [Ochromonadaceae sp. CCMP2298]|nr:hypothetical protein B484DRAFT_469286 [Ochromonadaceae sp. CCMP2298]
MKMKLVLVPVLVGMSLVYTPGFWVTLACFADLYTPWVLFQSPLYEAYHQFLLSRLPTTPELPLREIHHTQATLPVLLKLTNGFTFPIVIRGLLENSTTLSQWDKPSFWMDYKDEGVLCGSLFDLIPDCTVGKFFHAIEDGKPFYISGASEIFEQHPALHDMIDNEQIRSVEPGVRKSTQIFMGVPTMGSDIHCAVGINM